MTDQLPIIVWISGLPGCGKTSTARSLITRLNVDRPDLFLSYIEVGLAVRQIFSLEPHNTPMSDIRLLEYMKSFILSGDDVVIVSGAREPFLLRIKPQAVNIVVWLSLNPSTRSERFKIRDPHRDFEKETLRSIQLGVLDIEKRATIYSYTDFDTSDAVTRTAQLIDNIIKEVKVE